MLPLVMKSLRGRALQWGQRQLNIIPNRNTKVITRDASTHDDSEKNHHHLIKPEKLFSQENRERLLQRMQEAPPIGVRRTSTERNPVFAAVLICLCEDERGEVSILYTRRSMQISRHVRQISFPGGIKDECDADFIECALREAEEEIGLSRDLVDVWGTGKLITPPRTAAIMPVVGTVKNLNLNDLTLNEAEVEEAFIIPIKDLIQPTNIRYTQFKGGYSSPVFIIGPHKVWGVTGFITDSFLKCLIPMELKRLRNNVKYIRPFKHSK